MTDTAQDAHPVSLLPQHWLDNEHVAFGTKLLHVSDDPDGPLRQLVFTRLGAPTELFARDATASPAIEEKYLRRLEVFAPVTLKSLCALPDAALAKVWLPHRPYWHRALARLQNDGEISPIAGAMLVADRILRGTLTAPQLLRVANHELNCRWTASRQLYIDLSTLMDHLTRKRITTNDYFSAMAHFREAHRLDRWALVENALLHLIIFSPLLILRAHSGKQETQTEFSLPVAVDVFLDPKHRERFRSDGDGVIDHVNWQSPLENAIFAAKALWKNKHGSWPTEVKNSIAAASVVVDLRIAESIVRPYSADWATIELTGSSAETSLSLATLASFLDRTALQTTCATGKLGRFFRDPEGGGDHRVERMDPSVLELKFKRAADALVVDTMICPPAALTTKGHLRVCSGRTLSEFATHARLQWRKTQYIRTPDLAIAFRDEDPSKRYQEGALDDEVEYVLGQLRNNRTKPVFEFSKSLSEEIIRDCIAFST
ncbi:MAG: hypothetical protein Q8M24_25025 [Pseudolabrys sp.]|nr:hypothetical protein [Pseudolabrys sp.]MDP2298714.1 hypothetical protein [Pseudolabrys sp.]